MIFLKIIIVIFTILFVLAFLLGLLMTLGGFAPVGGPLILMSTVGLLACALLNRFIKKAAANKVEPTVDKPVLETQSEDTIRYVSVVCRRCGGVTQIPFGVEGICDYCDSPIKGET